VQDPHAAPSDHTLRVSVSSPILPYGRGKFDGRAPLTFSAQHDLKANFNCRKDTEVGLGVFRLRAPTDAEIAKMGEVYGTDPYRERDLYAVHDAADKPIGHGRCSVLKNPIPRPVRSGFGCHCNASCNFT